MNAQASSFTPTLSLTAEIFRPTNGQTQQVERAVPAGQMNVNVSGFKPTNRVGDSTNSFNTAATTFQPSSYQGAQKQTHLELEPVAQYAPKQLQHPQN